MLIDHEHPAAMTKAIGDDLIRKMMRRSKTPA